jgi:hypothetical protein
VARRLTVLLLAPLVVGCAKPEPDEPVEPEVSPLPTAGIASQPVAVYPLTLIAAERALGWQDSLRPREDALQAADSMIAAFLTERAPEVEWVLPDALRRAARQAPGILADPDKMGTAVLRGQEIVRVPDPLRSQLRNLTGVVGDRYAFLPTVLAYFATAEVGVARAELVVVLVDVRNGQVGWRTIARGEGEDPRMALWEALTSLVPELP